MHRLKALIKQCFLLIFFQRVCLGDAFNPDINSRFGGCEDADQGHYVLDLAP